MSIRYRINEIDIPAYLNDDGPFLMLSDRIFLSKISSNEIVVKIIEFNGVVKFYSETYNEKKSEQNSDYGSIDDNFHFSNDETRTIETDVVQIVRDHNIWTILVAHFV